MILATEQLNDEMTTGRNDSDAELSGAWARYISDRDEDARGEIAMHYMPLVERCAAKVARTLPRHVDRDDLVSAGMVGLMDAIDAFDPDRGVAFGAFCLRRVRGAMIDELRSADWLPRTARRKARELSDARQGLEQRFGHSPSDEQVRDELGLTVKEFRRYRKVDRRTSFVTLSDLQRTNTDSDRGIAIADPASEQAAVDRRLMIEDLKRIIAEELEADDRLIVVLYHFEGMTLKEIGLTLGLTESRICQRLRSIHNRLHDRVCG
ncbi:MAG: FliA/WhiG family RNA polymerase sigma factor [Phycisphaera sp.]|nr:FliA/WhiG family RNA polymerase sigma factor [Phycisphaera sp.]